MSLELMQRGSHHEPAVFNEIHYDPSLAFGKDYVGDFRRRKPYKSSSLQSIPRQVLATRTRDEAKQPSKDTAHRTE